MSFWSVAGPEPKRNYRWVMVFTGTGGMQNISFALKKVDKPKNKVGETSHKYLNHTFYYPGRLEWEPISMTIASVSDPDATATLNQILINAGYGVPNNAGLTPDQLSTIGKNKFNVSLGAGMSLQQLNADGGKIEEWTIRNPFFTNVNYGSLDYSSEDIVEISCTVRYDWAQLTFSAPMGTSDSAGNPVSPGFP